GDGAAASQQGGGQQAGRPVERLVVALPQGRRRVPGVAGAGRPGYTGLVSPGGHRGGRVRACPELLGGLVARRVGIRLPVLVAHVAIMTAAPGTSGRRTWDFYERCGRACWRRPGGLRYIRSGTGTPSRPRPVTSTRRARAHSARRLSRTAGS